MEDREASTESTQTSLLPCDIVMAGGVTSGIIYPGAVAMIARRFSFHSIGGTCVGAIAAAITAAAEYGRRTRQNPNAFNLVADLAKSLAEQAPDGHSRLFHLFTPENHTRALFSLVTPLLRSSSLLEATRAVLRSTFSTW